MSNMVGHQHFTKGELRKAIAEIRKKAKEEVKTWVLDPGERAELCFWVEDDKRDYFFGALSHDKLDYSRIRDTLTEIEGPVDYMKVHLEAGWCHAPDDIDHGFVIKDGNLSIY